MQKYIRVHSDGSFYYSHHLCKHTNVNNSIVMKTRLTHKKLIKGAKYQSYAYKNTWKNFLKIEKNRNSILILNPQFGRTIKYSLTVVWGEDTVVK